jgi:hypothetical protein
VQTVDFPLIGGVDQSSSAKLLVAPRLLRAENLRVVEKRTVQKRRGTVELAGGDVDAGSPTPIGPVRLATHKGQVLVCSEQSLWTVASDGAKLEELDAMPSTTLESVVPLGHYGAANVVSSGVAETTAFRVWAWVTFDATTYRLHIQTVDLARGAGTAATQYKSSTSSGMKCLKVIAIGDKVTVLWGDSTNEIRYVDITSATSGPYSGQTGTALYSDASMGFQWFDAAPHETGYCLVYKISPTQCKVKRLSSAHAELATATITPANMSGSPRLAITGNATSIAVAVASDHSTTLALFWYNNSLTQTATATFSDSTVWGSTSVESVGVAIGTYQSTGTLMIALTAFNASSKYGFKVGTCTTAGALELTNLKINARVASRPWVYGGEVFCLVSYWSGTQGNSYYAVVGHTGGPIATVARQHPLLEARVRDARATQTPLDDCAASVAQTGSACAVSVPAVDRFSSPGVAVDPTGQAAIDPDGETAIGVQTITLVGVDGFHFEHASRARWQAATVGDYTCFSGGVIGKFDGRRRTEIGFPSFPYCVSTVTTGTGGVEDGTFATGVCWEWVDYLGNREQSAVYFTQDLVVANPNDVLLSQADIPAFHQKSWLLTGGDQRDITFAIYRTDADGTLMHRVEGGSAALFDRAVGANTFSVATYSDNNTSTSMSLVSRELIYASQFGSNELQHQMPPPSNAICGHENRLFFVNAEEPTLVGYTLQQFPGQALAWNASFVIKFDVPIVALASQDGNLIAFGTDTIYTVTGQAPDNTGASTGYDPPVLLSGHLGTTDRRSVVASPAGLWFRSARGLEVLPRGGGAAMWLGERIRTTLDAYPIITAALHNPNASEVLFSCVTAETVAATGVVLAYDYDSDVWFVRSYQGNPISDMTLDDGDVIFGIYDSAAGLTLWKEDTGFDDADGSFVGTVLETGDIRLAAASGMQSMWRGTVLGKSTGRSILTVEESADGGAYMGRQFQLTTEDELERQYETFQRKAKRHRLRLTESTAGTADVEGVAYMVLTLDVAPLNGSTRSAAQVRG